MNLRSFPDRQALASELSAHLSESLSRRVVAVGRASLAVSGGNTPVPLFERLAQTDVPWEKVVITLADERWVDTSSPDSNERLVREHLLRSRAAAALFVGLKNAAESAAAGEADCDRQLRQIFLPFTAVILGMGNDGHIASLFPCAEQLAQAADMGSGKLCAAVRPQTAPYERMTLTLPTLLKAQEIILHIAGLDKKAVLTKALTDGPPEEMPIRFILRQETVQVTVYWAP